MGRSAGILEQGTSSLRPEDPTGSFQDVVWSGLWAGEM